MFFSPRNLWRCVCFFLNIVDRANSFDICLSSLASGSSSCWLEPHLWTRSASDIDTLNLIFFLFSCQTSQSLRHRHFAVFSAPDGSSSFAYDFSELRAPKELPASQQTTAPVHALGWSGPSPGPLNAQGWTAPPHGPRPPQADPHGLIQ